MPFRYYWEDFTPGKVFEHGARALSEEDIVRFAREWDPQRYHADPQKAKQTPFGGLIASGWQSCAVLMRMMCDAYLNESSCVGSPGIDEIRFLLPVRPGDSLRFRSTVIESNPSRAKPGRGSVLFRWELLNQNNDVALSMIGRQFYLRRAFLTESGAESSISSTADKAENPGPASPPPPSSAYVGLENGTYAATGLTRGPWHPDHQHAGPPIALVARSIERAAAALDLTHIARLTANLLRPIPISQLAVEVQTEYAGRNVAHFSARLVAGGKDVARFTAVAQREGELDLPAGLPGHPLPRAPRSVEDSLEARFPFSTTVLGYQDLMENRIAEGVFFRGPSAVWFRMRYPLVAGEEPSPVQRVAVAADSGNGISAVLDFRSYVFVNSDLTINLLRKPQGEWICIDARTLLGSSGGGLAEARIFDSLGLVGRSTQSLAIRLRE